MTSPNQSEWAMRLQQLHWLLLISLTACSNPFAGQFQIEFKFDASCGEGTLSFYLSDPVLITAEGTSEPLHFDIEIPWQSERVGLISMARACAPSPDMSGNARLQASAAPGDYRYLEFSLGVPFDLNHVNPLEATPPLDVSSMFWVWQTGYKFLRYDVGRQWSFHLGSTGCHSASAVRAPAAPCTQPNLARIRVPLTDPATARIEIDVDALIAGIDIHEAKNCVEAYGEDPACKVLVERLGLNPESGQCINECEGQVLFRAGAESQSL